MKCPRTPRYFDTDYGHRIGKPPRVVRPDTRARPAITRKAFGPFIGWVLSAWIPDMWKRPRFVLTLTPPVFPQ